MLDGYSLGLRLVQTLQSIRNAALDHVSVLCALCNPFAAVEREKLEAWLTKLGVTETGSN